MGSQVIAAPLSIDQSPDETPRERGGETSGESAEAPPERDATENADEPGVTADIAEPPAPLATITFSELAIVLLGVGCVWLFVNRRWHRLKNAPGRPNLFPPLIGAALFIAIMMLETIGVSIAGYLLGLAEREPGSYTFREHTLLRVGQYVGGVPIVIAYFLMLKSAPRLGLDRRFDRRRCLLVAVGALLLTWPVLYGVGRIVAYLVHLVSGEGASSVAHDTLQRILDSDGHIWTIVTIGLVTLLAPLVEEVMYRGLIQRSLVRAGVSRWGAIVLTSVVFAAAHIAAAPANSVFVLTISLFVLSLSLGWAYEKTGRLLTPIVMHGLFNAVNVAMAYGTQSG